MNKLWYKEANCKGIPTIDFYPDHKGRTVVPQHIVVACSKCTVKQDCLETAIWNEEEGTWAGMLPTERKRYRWSHPEIFGKEKQDEQSV